jgi:hypothetical protein
MLDGAAERGYAARVKRMLSAIVVGVATVVLLALPAGAQAYPPQNTGVGGAGAQAAGQQLAFTGSDGTSTLLIVALAAVLAGTVLLLAAKARRRSVA